MRQICGEVRRVHNTPVSGLSLLALGGYGRKLLFPYSDLDILFLFGSDKAEEEFRPLIADFARPLWDLGFRVSSAVRTVEECKRIDEVNADFLLALMVHWLHAASPAFIEYLISSVLPTSLEA